MRGYYSKFLVFLQFLFILSILLTAPILNHLNYWLLIEVSGFVLVLWAVYEMKLGNFNIQPLVRTDGVLVTSGPYFYIRHPMYLATLMVMIPLVGEYFSYWRLSFIITLCIVFIIKINFEEKELIKSFQAYPNYIKKTKKLIPYIY